MARGGTKGIVTTTPRHAQTGSGVSSIEIDDANSHVSDVRELILVVRRAQHG